MDSVLNRIVSNDTKNQKEQAKQTSLLADILAVQKNILKVEENSLKTESREKQKAKRSTADRSPSSAVKRKEKKEEEKESKGLLGKLLGLGGIGKIIGGSTLLIAGLATAVGAAMALYFKNKKFRDAVNKATTVMWEFTRDNVLTPSWDWIKKKGPEAYRWLQKEILVPSVAFLKKQFYDMLPDWMKPKTANSASEPSSAGGREAQKLEEEILKIFTGRKRGEFTRKAVNSQRALGEEYFNASMRGQDKIAAFAKSNKVKDTLARAIKAGREMDGMQSRVQENQALLDDPNAALLPGARQALIDDIKKDKTNAVIKKQQIEVLKEELKKLKEEEKLIKKQQREVDEKGFHFGGLFYNQGKDLFGGFQKGGHVNVPGTGDGDKVPMMLPSGSFVMNRNASMMLQNGGMVPTLLEPGEKVFGPGQWGPMEQMMNSTFSRFREGGELSGGIKFDSNGNMLTYKGGKWVLDKPGQQKKDTPTKGQDSTVPAGAPTSEVEGTNQATFEPLNNIRTGGKMTFIGDGSGYTGEVKLIDGNNKVVAAIGGVSGQARTAGASQADRKNVSGTMNPLPDGKFPLEPGVAYHPGNELGNWSAWINNPGGKIGARGGLMVHNDLGSDGTAGCIGIEAGGTAGSANSMKFAEVYDRVQPSDVDVKLGSSSGKSYIPGTSGGGGDGDDFFSQLGAGLGKLSPLLQAFANFGMKFSGLSAVPGALSQFFTGGDSPSAPGSGSGSAPEVTPGAKGLLDFIAHYESGGSYNKIFGGAEVAGLTDMTINQVVDYQKAFLKRTGAESAAIGRYQMMYPEEYADKAGVPRDAKFSEANQDKMAMAYLEEDGWSRYKSGQLSASKFADNVAGTWAALPMASGASAHAGVGSNAALVDRATYMKQIGAAKLQTGGIVNMSGNNTSSGQVMSKSQQAFAEQIASAVTPIVIPVPTGGGSSSGGGGGGRGPSTEFPMLPAEDSSVVSMEYKYRITMGASV